MEAKEVKEKFDKLKNHSEYVRVSETHPLELYFGLNDQGSKVLRFNGNFTHTRVNGNSLLTIQQRRNANGTLSISFCYDSIDNVSLFYQFCADMVTETEHAIQENGYECLVNRYSLWKKMFHRSRNLLTEPQIMGLIGELLFLKDYSIPKFGESEALEGWSGPEPTHKDFSYRDEWYEVKTCNDSKPSVTISSIEQLDGSSDGHLIVYFLEKMSPDFNGVTLNSIVQEIRTSLRFDRDVDLFFDKLSQIGYTPQDAYDDYVYSLKYVSWYRVGGSFPRIKKNSIPKGILSVKYDILISEIEDYLEEVEK